MESAELAGKILSTWLALVLGLILLPSAFGVSLGISELYMKILVKTLEVSAEGTPARGGVLWCWGPVRSRGYVCAFRFVRARATASTAGLEGRGHDPGQELLALRSKGEGAEMARPPPALPWR